MAWLLIITDSSPSCPDLYSAIFGFLGKKDSPHILQLYFGKL